MANIKRATRIADILGFHEVRYKSPKSAIALMKRLCAIRARGTSGSAELVPAGHRVFASVIRGQQSENILLRSRNHENTVIIYASSRTGDMRITNAYNGLSGALKKG